MPSSSSLYPPRLSRALAGSPEKTPIVLPPPSTRLSTAATLCAMPAVDSDALSSVDESSAPSSPSTLGYADALDVDEWARTPLPTRRELHHSLWPEREGSPRPPPPGPPPQYPLPPPPPRPLPRRPLPDRPQPKAHVNDKRALHTRSFSDSAAQERRAHPPPPLDLSAARVPHATRAVQPTVDTETQARRARHAAYHQAHGRGGSLSALSTEAVAHASPGEVSRAGSRLQRVGRIPPAPAHPFARVPDEGEGEEITFARVHASEIGRARAARPRPAVVVDMAGFCGGPDAHRYAYHDRHRFASSLGEEEQAQQDARGGLGWDTETERAATPQRAPTQSALLRAIEAQIGSADFTPAPSPLSRRGSRKPVPPLRPHAAHAAHAAHGPLADTLRALTGRSRVPADSNVVVERHVSVSSVVELGDAAGDSERTHPYTFKPPRGLLPSVVPPRPPRSPLREDHALAAPPRPARSELRRPPTPRSAEMEDIALTPVGVDFSRPRSFLRFSRQGPPRIPDLSGARPVRLTDDAYELGARKKVTLDIPSAISSALPATPTLTPRTPRTPRKAEAGILPALSLGRKRAGKPPLDEKKRKKRLMLGLGLGVLVVIVILASVLIAKNKRRAAPAPAPEADKEIEQAHACVRAWAAGDHAGFECAGCAGPLQRLANDFTGNGTAGVGAARQYCALMDVWDGVAEADDAGLRGWGESQDPCIWAGVGCDARGRVTSLELRAPAMPREMPALDGLVSLQQLRLKGNGSAPIGLLDTAPLRNLTLLNAEYTMLQRLAVGNVSSLVLVHNPHLDLPDLSNTSVATLAATYQNISALDPSTLPPGLNYLDLSFNQLSGKLPNLDLPLRNLYVQGNRLKSLGSLPDMLESANLSENPLEAVGDLCDRELSMCELRGTKLNATSCGTCLLS